MGDGRAADGGGLGSDAACNLDSVVSIGSTVARLAGAGFGGVVLLDLEDLGGAVERVVDQCLPEGRSLWEGWSATVPESPRRGRRR